MKRALKIIDWFIPDASRSDLSDLSLARNFVFTHLFGPLLSQSISIFLYRTDPEHGFACWTMIACIWMFWTLPFVLRYTRNLQKVALVSVELLAFTSLFGAYHYGGVSSPFLPWLLVSLLLGFFYLSERPILVISMFSFNICVFSAAYALYSLPNHVPLSQMGTVGWISIMSGFIYMSWMAIYYASIMSMRSDAEREAERHRATAVRLQQAKDLADKANLSKSIFLAKMSHELRTPLNAVIGFSEILMENFEDEARYARKKEDLLRINGAGKHLLSLVADVLDLSKIENNHIDLKIETFNLERLVRDVAATAKQALDQHGNTIAISCGSALGEVTTDATKLRQVILNLLSNGAKFTKAGMIALSVRREKKPGGDWIEIQVRDSGIGIAKADLARLFQSFGQASPATSGQYGGTGLGLVISQKFCALMGGAITVTSELGRGSCFAVRLPAVWSADDGQCSETLVGHLPFVPESQAA